MVWARLPDYKHYGLGFISKKDWRYQVKFPDGTHLYHSLHDPLGLVLDRAPSTQAVSVGCDVIGCIPEKPLMYPGRVTKILEGSYQVQYDNGQTHENGIDDLRVLKVPESEGKA